MQKYIYLLFAFCGLAYIQGYKIPNVNLELLSLGFRVSIPDETGISNVLYTIEINEMCPAIMDYVTIAKNGFWTSVQNKTQLYPQDRLTIFLLVEHSNEVFKATENLKIEKDLKYRSIQTSDVVNLSKEYDRNSCEILRKSPGECTPSETVSSSADRACKGDLLFDETFDIDKILNLNRWTFDIRMLLAFQNEEFALFDNNEINQFIQDGVFNIVPTVQGTIRSGSIILGRRCTAQTQPQKACSRTAIPRHKTCLPPVHSTVIHSKNSFSFKFGRVEVRAQLPKGDWILPYIMLQESSKFVDAADANQIRIGFARGNNKLTTFTNEEIGGRHLYGGIYYRPNLTNFEDIRDKKRDNHWGDDFHIYELTWKPTQISLAVDGETYGEIGKSVNEEHFIVLGVSVGGHVEFSNDVSKPWTNTEPLAVLDFFRDRNNWKNTWSGSEGLKVDYVKVYAV